MTNPFGTHEMAAGYAKSRPPVHPHVLERASRHLPGPIRQALDVGCGAGLSTRALQGIATHSIGMEPAEAMLRWTGAVAPESDFLVGAAEAIPLASGSLELITAAGSLNYVDLEQFFPEAARVLAATGVLLVYDFSAGQRFTDGPGLENWFEKFQTRYPPPPNEARALDPDRLSQLRSGFRVQAHEYFTISIALSSRFYIDYMMTETNVAFALRNGVAYEEIRAWCEKTLAPVWTAEQRNVRFDGYFACMTRM